MNHSVENFDQARAAGFSPARAARWAAYIDMKTANGEQPIPLWEAVLQVEAASRH